MKRVKKLQEQSTRGEGGQEKEGKGWCTERDAQSMSCPSLGLEKKTPQVLALSYSTRFCFGCLL